MDPDRADSLTRVAVLTIVGEIDIASAGGVLREATRRIEADGPDLVLDLSDVTFMDSSGLSMLVSVRDECVAQGGQLVLIGVRGQTRKLFRLTGLDFMLDGFRH